MSTWLYPYGWAFVTQFAMFLSSKLTRMLLRILYNMRVVGKCINMYNKVSKHFLDINKHHKIHVENLHVKNLRHHIGTNIN